MLSVDVNLGAQYVPKIHVRMTAAFASFYTY